MIDARLILLVEDSPDDAYFFQRAVRRAGVPFICTHALNGSEAVDILVNAHARQQLPAAIFLDLKMPVMNGFEVLEWIQQQPFASLIPIFVLSGSNQQEDRDRARRLGASDYLVKPVGSEELARTVGQIGAKSSEGVAV
jgi:CheY-like chemotaxis protein